ncbi:MAG TPA: hypothetical protein VFX30_10180 [bacterium]|nr:hypothetical protein [bacterium]
MLPLQAVSRFRVALGFVLFFLVVVFVGIAVDHPAVTGLGIGCAVVALLFALILGLSLRHLRKRMETLVSGEVLAHWVFSEDEWASHIRLVRGRLRSEVPRYAAIGGILGVLLGTALMAFRVYGEKAPWGTEWRFPALIAGGFTALFVIVGLIWDLYERLTLRAWRRCREVYIGASGLYIGGDFWAGQRPGPRFLKARYEASPRPLLLFDFEIRVKNGSYLKEVAVPVPSGAESRAREIAAWVQTAWR